MATATIPTIKLDMHQRTASDNERTHRHYLLVDAGMGLPELITADQTDWNWAHRIANVEVELPEIMWGTAEEIRASIREAAIDEAHELHLISFPWD
jgi:hypothetical protein